MTERRDNFIAFARNEIERYKAGERARPPSIGELVEPFEFNYSTGCKYLSEEGLNIAGLVKGKLSEIVTREITLFQAGEIDHFSTIPELAQRVGREEVTVRHHLEQTGLFQHRSRLETSTHLENLLPSEDFAWLLGALAGGGWVQKYEISLTSYSEELLSKFKSIGERLFKLNGHEYIDKVNQDGRLYKKIKFSNKEAAEALGYLHPDQWPRTILDKHPWIHTHPNYIWKFLEGQLETGVSIDTKTNKRMNFNTHYRAVANTIADMLVHVGIKKPTINPDKNTREGIKGITVSNIKDLKVIAEHIHSVIPEIEDKLQFYRDLPEAKPRAEIRSDEEVIAEWRRLTNDLQRPPLSTDIQRLKRTDDTKFSHHVYINRFGDGTFTGAKAILDRIVAGEKILAQDYKTPAKAASTELNESGQEVQIFP